MAQELTQLAPNTGAQQARTRLGRGQGSGLGKTAGRGTKGQKARSGASKGKGFEGGQIPLKRRLPKFGFTCPSSQDVEVLNVDQLNGFADGTTITAELLLSTGILSRVGRNGVKLLGSGSLEKKLVVCVACSASARQKVEQAGGSVEQAQ